jgi:hypothetical protein
MSEAERRGIWGRVPVIVRAGVTLLCNSRAAGSIPPG